MGTSQDNHDHEYRGDFHSDASSRIDQDLTAFDGDMGQVDRAMDVVSELDNKQETIQSMGSYNQDMSQMVQASVESLLRVANIGYHSKSRPDLQSYKFTSKEADLQSIGETASKVWDGIINAIKKAIEWVVGLFKRIFGIGKNTDKKIEKIEELVKETKEKSPSLKQLSTPYSQKSKSFQFGWTPWLDMLFNAKDLKLNADSLPRLQRNITFLKRRYEDWGDKGVFDATFFAEPAPSQYLKEHGAPNRSKGYISETLGKKAILVYGPPQVPTSFDGRRGEEYIKGVVMKVLPADYIGPMVGKDITVLPGHYNPANMLQYLKQHRVALEEFETWCNSFVQKSQATVDKLSKSSTKDDTGRTTLAALKFLIAGPAIRYVAMWNQALDAVATDVTKLMLTTATHT